MCYNFLKKITTGSSANFLSPALNGQGLNIVPLKNFILIIGLPPIFLEFPEALEIRAFRFSLAKVFAS